MAEALIKTEGITKVYQTGDEVVHALRGISLEIFEGEYISIMGPSGSGKSTFFNMVGALDTPSDGEVWMAGRKLKELSNAQLAWIRCHNIGYIFQSFNLIPTMTAMENCAIARIFSGKSPAQAQEDAETALTKVGLGDRMDHVPGALSGGQQQRVAIARAIVNKPSIILADEPTGNLDLHTGEDIINLLGEMQKELGITIVTATHDTKMLAMSDRVVWIKDGAVDRVKRRDEIKISTGTIDGSVTA